MRIEFPNQTAVVTGGANGIGAAAARLFAESGARVVIFDREDAAEFAASIGATSILVDVTDRSSIAAAFDQSGVPDVVIVNAGTAVVASLDATTDESWRRTIDLNLTAAFVTLREAAQRMKTRRRGSIVLTASTNSYDGEPSLIAYNASKAGLLGILHTAANELGPHGIRVNAVCPGLIRTRLTESAFQQPAVVKDYFRAIPMGRGGMPVEVAQAMVFLASEAASYITGATLLVDGGQMAGKFGPWNEEIAEFDRDHWTLR